MEKKTIYAVYIMFYYILVKKQLEKSVNVNKIRIREILNLKVIPFLLIYIIEVYSNLLTDNKEYYKYKQKFLNNKCSYKKLV